MRRPCAHRLFELPKPCGLSNLLRTEERPFDSVARGTPEAGQKVFTTGALPPNPAELLAFRRIQETLRRLRGYSDVVIVDSQPRQLVDNAAILASEVDGTLLVIDSGRTSRAAGHHAVGSAEARKRPAARIRHQSAHQSDRRLLQVEVNRLSALPGRRGDENNQLQTADVRLVQCRSAYSSLPQFPSHSAATILSAVDPTLRPTGPSTPGILLNTALAAVLGPYMALGILFLVEYLDDSQDTGGRPRVRASSNVGTHRADEDQQAPAGLATTLTHQGLPFRRQSARSAPT